MSRGTSRLQLTIPNETRPNVVAQFEVVDERIQHCLVALLHSAADVIFGVECAHGSVQCLAIISLLFKYAKWTSYAA